MNETALQSRAEKLLNPFIDALDKYPHLTGTVTRHNETGKLPTPGISVSASGGVEREDHAGDSWGFDVTIQARRAASDADNLDADLAAIEWITSNAMAGDPNIDLLIAEEEGETRWEEAGKARTVSLTIPVLVVFS